MKTLSSEEKFRSHTFWVTEDTVQTPDGYEFKKAVVHHRGSSAMMAVDDRKRILLIRQFRVAPGRKMWELPAGSLDEGETALQTAKRELIEETGYRARKWLKLASFYPSPGFLSERITVFLATDLTEGEAQPMEDERIESRWFAAKEVGAMIDAGRIIDGKTIIGYSRWRSLGKKA